MTTYKDIEHKELLEELHYEPETGEFFWLVGGQGRRLGKPIGYLSTSPYQTVTYNNVVVRMNRMAWFYMTGKWPPEDMVIDYEDGNTKNNKWSNLRLATDLQNAANRRRRQQTLSGAKGVHLDPVSGLWVIQIIYDGVKHVFGPVESLTYAHKIHERESKRIREEFHRPSILRQQRAVFNNDEVTQAVKDFIKNKTLVNGRYI